MAISLVGNASGGPGNPSVTVTLPAGIAQNDVVYAQCHSTAISDIDIVENSGTYTELADLYVNDTADTNFGLYRKVQGATPDSSVAINGGGVTVAVAMTLRGGDTTTPEDAATTTASAMNSGTPDPPSIVTVTANAWVLAFGGSSEADAVINPPTNYTDLIDIQNTNSNAMASRRLIASPATEDPGTYADVVGTTADSWAAATVAVRPAPEPPVTSMVMQHMGEGIGDTGVHAGRVPQTLHTINQGICCEFREAA